jgi:hypothetical protein
MSSEHLNSLAKTGLLKPEPPDQTEFNGLVASGTKRLKDACNEANSTESRFDLAYNAAHAITRSNALAWIPAQQQKVHRISGSGTHARACR